jgi:proliferating cell nuclear antigen
MAIVNRDDRYLVKIQTVQPSNFKSLFTTLKDNNITDVNINISQEGIEILQMDPTHIVIVHIKLRADNFEYYYCKSPIKIGVDTVNLTKLLKGLNAKDMLTLFVEDPKEQLYDRGDNDEIDSTVTFGILIENANKGQIQKIMVNIIDVNDQPLSDPDLNYPYQIQMPSADLQSIVTNLKNVGGETVRIVFHKDTLQFYTKGELSSSDLTRSRTNHEDTSLKIQKNIDDDVGIIEIYVLLEKLVEFSKCYCLSPIVTIYLQNDFPLIFEYDVGSLGIIHLGVSPRKKPDDF